MTVVPDPDDGPRRDRPRRRRCRRDPGHTV